MERSWLFLAIIHLCVGAFQVLMFLPLPNGLVYTKWMLCREGLMFRKNS